MFDRQSVVAFVIISNTISTRQTSLNGAELNANFVDVDFAVDQFYFELKIAYSFFFLRFFPHLFTSKCSVLYYWKAFGLFD